MKVRTKKRISRLSRITFSIFFMIAITSMLIPVCTQAIIRQTSANYNYMDLNTVSPIYVNTNIADSEISAVDDENLAVSDSVRKQWILASYGLENDYWSSSLATAWESATEITSVSISLRADSTSPTAFNEPGHFAWCENYSLTGWDFADPWAGSTTWTNSTEYDDYNVQTGLPGVDKFHLWYDITELRNWSIGILNSSSSWQSLRVYWITNASPTAQVWDYLGFSFSFLYDTPYDPPTNETVVGQLHGAIWLLVIFLPGMLLGQVIPQIGFLVGISIMLIAMLSAYGSFIPITLMGLVCVGVYVYRGESNK